MWVAFSVLVTVVVGAIAVVLFLQPGPTVSSRAHPPLRVPESTTGSPTPSSTPTPRLEPADSALHRVRLMNQHCPDFRLRRGNVPKDELPAYLESVIDCLDRIHREPFAELGVTLTKPGLAPETEVSRSGCITGGDGQDDWAGIYCGASSTIYYRSDWSPGAAVQYVDVMAHEYAHHLQERTGILEPVSIDQAAAEKEPNGAIRSHELSRRVELQAECVAGLLTRPEGPFGLRESDFQELVYSRGSVPTEWAATHGSGRAQTRWFKAGARSSGPEHYAACNTFTAAADTIE